MSQKTIRINPRNLFFLKNGNVVYSSVRFFCENKNQIKDKNYNHDLVKLKENIIQDITIETNKELTNKELTNKELTNKELTNKEATNKEATNKEATNKEATNKEATNKELKIFYLEHKDLFFFLFVVFLFVSITVGLWYVLNDTDIIKLVPKEVIPLPQPEQIIINEDVTNKGSGITTKKVLIVGGCLVIVCVGIYFGGPTITTAALSIDFSFLTDFLN